MNVIYLDSEGRHIVEGDYVKDPRGKKEKVYEGFDYYETRPFLGLNASNENYIHFHPLFRELYPFKEFAHDSYIKDGVIYIQLRDYTKVI